MMTKKRETAQQPEDLARLFVERGNAADAEGLAALYEPDAVLGFPPGSETVGHDAILAVLKMMLEGNPHFELEEALPTLRNGDLALTSTIPKDGTGGRTQVVRRQADGSWLRVLDRPEVRS